MENSEIEFAQSSLNFQNNKDFEKGKNSTMKGSTILSTGSVVMRNPNLP